TDILTIESLFISEDIITALNNHRVSLFNESVLEFYTDGSHQFFSSPLRTFISSAFVFVHDSLDISFAAALPPLWANSTNAEIFALLMTLFVCPFGSFVKINTDSLSLILAYNRILQKDI
ncbi:14446_t:CDS:1, partial [Funneliformis geosporum]